jgi:hypothetical protein
MRRVLVVILLVVGLLACATSAPVFFLPAAATQSQPAGDPNIKVWVDTKYGFYHCPGTKWYGATSQGVFMTQQQAQFRRYRPAYEVCR